MNNRVRKFFKKFEDMNAAVAFAEAGEFDTAREMVKEKKSILLVLAGTDKDKQSFTYALNACKRLEAEMEILFTAQKDPQYGAQFFEELERANIMYIVRKDQGCLRETILELTKKRDDLLFVVVDPANIDGTYQEKGNPHQVDSNFLTRLGCPLVVVESHSR